MRETSNRAAATVKRIPTLLLTAIWLAILLGCEQQNDTQQATQHHNQTVSQATADVSAENVADKQNAENASTAGDMQALINVMHGAAAQQPDNAPKDKYGNPYIIGDLGGVPVNLPPSVVEFVEYNDSPGWDMDAVRNYHPPVRSYASKFKSFGFEFRASDGVLYDREDLQIFQAYEAVRKSADNNWVDVIVLSGEAYGGYRKWMSSLLEDKINPDYPNRPTYWKKTDEHPYGLDLYINPGIDPKTGEAWRKNEWAEDIFTIEKDDNIVTYIECSNRDVMRPPCAHHFLFPEDMKLRATLSYSRRILPHWQAIEKQAIAHLRSFATDQQPGDK